MLSVSKFWYLQNPFGSFSDDDEEEEIPPAAKIAAIGVGRVAINNKGGNRSVQPTVDLPPSVVDPVVIPPAKAYVFLHSIHRPPIIFQLLLRVILVL